MNTTDLAGNPLSHADDAALAHTPGWYTTRNASSARPMEEPSREDQQAAGGTGHGQRQVMVKQALRKGTSIHLSEERVQ